MALAMQVAVFPVGMLERMVSLDITLTTGSFIYGARAYSHQRTVQTDSDSCQEAQSHQQPTAMDGRVMTLQTSPGTQNTADDTVSCRASTCVSLVPGCFHLHFSGRIEKGLRLWDLFCTMTNFFSLKSGQIPRSRGGVWEAQASWRSTGPDTSIYSRNRGPVE